MPASHCPHCNLLLDGLPAGPSRPCPRCREPTGAIVPAEPGAELRPAAPEEPAVGVPDLVKHMDRLVVAEDANKTIKIRFVFRAVLLLFLGLAVYVGSRAILQGDTGEAMRLFLGLLATGFLLALLVAFLYGWAILPPADISAAEEMARRLAERPRQGVGTNEAEEGEPTTGRAAPPAGEHIVRAEGRVKPGGPEGQ
jgi:hypothetical protein